MDNSLILPLISYMQSLSIESLSVILFLFSAVIILFMFRYFGLAGLYVYSAISTVIANIQVLKLGKFSLISDPMALGTVTFATIFLSNDIITEHFGKQAAQKNIWLSFITQIIVTCVMIIAIGFKPVDGDGAHDAISMLFLPAPRLLLASLTAFLISQFININIFQRLSRFYNEKKLWLRSNLSLMISAFIDNSVFSLLAWVILAPNPVSNTTLIYTYILGTYAFIIILSLFSTPIIYLSHYFKPEAE